MKDGETKFDPKTDDTDVFISDIKQTAHQLNHNIIAVLNLIKPCMPADTCCTLYLLHEKDVAIVIVKDICQDT